jgi:hypothetical protein
MINCLKKCLGLIKEEKSMKYQDVNPDMKLNLKVLVWEGQAVVRSIFELNCGDYYIAKRTYDYYGKERVEYAVVELCGDEFSVYNSEFEALLKLRSLNN